MIFSKNNNLIIKSALFFIAIGIVVGTGSLYRFLYNYNLIMLATMVMMVAVLSYQLFLPSFKSGNSEIFHLPAQTNYSGLMLLFAMLFLVFLSDIINNVESLQILIFYSAILIVSILLDEQYRKKIFEYYLFIIVGLSAISLVFISLSLFTNILESIPHIRQDSKFVTDFYYVWSTPPHILFSRNQSIFWEPGAFGYHIILATLLAYKCKNKIFISILLITAITTFSTTVYIFLFFLFIFHLLYSKNKILISISMVASVLILFTIITTILDNNVFLRLATSAIFDKFSPSSNTYISFAGRSLYTLESLKLFLDNMFIGVGHYGTATKLEVVRSGVTVNSSGLFGLLAEFGLYGFFCIYLYIRFFNYFKVLAIPITLIWLNGEFLQYSPMSLLMLADATGHFAKKIFP